MVWLLFPQRIKVRPMCYRNWRRWGGGRGRSEHMLRSKRLSIQFIRGEQYKVACNYWWKYIPVMRCLCKTIRCVAHEKSRGCYANIPKTIMLLLLISFGVFSWCYSLVIAACKETSELLIAICRCIFCCFIKEVTQKFMFLRRGSSSQQRVALFIVHCTTYYDMCSSARHHSA